MKRFISLFVIALYAMPDALSQRVISNIEEGYYIKGNTVISGIRFEKATETERAERVIIPDQPAHLASVLYPADIEEYGFLKGGRYISADIVLSGKTEKVFLEEKINLDSIIVYAYPVQGGSQFFFQQRNEVPTLINDGNRLWDLFQITDCPEMAAIVASKKPKKLDDRSLYVHCRAYNERNTNLFPVFHYGITTEIGLQSSDIKQKTNESKGSTFSFMIGAFVQIPMDECFCFQPEVLYSYIYGINGQMSGTKQQSSGKGLYIRESFQFPIVFRHNFNYKKGKTIPYIDLGPLLDIKKMTESGLPIDSYYPTDEKPNHGILSNTKVNPFQYGFVLGAGIEHKLNSKHSIYTGLRFKYLEGNGRDNTMERFSYFSVNMAYGF